MNKFLRLLALGLLGGSAMGGGLVREGDLWRFYKGRSTPAAGWTNIVYLPATNWGGPAPTGYGYGDDDDTTILSDMQNDYVSLFLRKEFSIASTSGITFLTLAADYDDGFVAYLNGREVVRRHMPPGAVTHLTTAADGHEASRSGANEYNTELYPNEKEYFELDPAILMMGTNVIAVSGHNQSLSSSDFSLFIDLYTNVTLLRGPLLQLQHRGQVTVTWRTDALTDSVVAYGPDGTYSEGNATDTNLVRDHVVELPALPPGVPYYYRLSSDGVVLASNVFRSPPNEMQSTRMAVLGDFGGGSANAKAVANRVAAANPDFKITVGDNIYASGQPGSFDPYWFQPYSNLIGRALIMPALGNHDNTSETGRWMLVNFTLPTNGPAGLTERNYAFDIGNIHAVAIDSTVFDENVTASMAAITNWLDADLAATTQLWKFVYFHHPPYTSQGSHADLEAMKSQVAPILERRGVQFAFQGHNHFYERINPINRVHYITSGAGGMSLYPITARREFSAAVVDDVYSYALVDVEGPHFTLRCIDQFGVQHDLYRYDLDHPFALDGVIDSTNWVRAANGLRLNAAIRGYHLYVATQDAGEGSDHFIYVNNQLSNSVLANWAKAGQIMQWGAFLADEDDGAFTSWFGPQQQVMTDAATYRAMTSGLDDNGANGNGVLEGTLQLAQHFGSFPSQLTLAAAPYASADGGALVADAQVPVGNGDGNILSNEFLAVSTRALALDLPVAHVAPSAGGEAGVWVSVDGSGSTAPSGLPLAFSWAQIGGDAGEFQDASSAQAAFRLTNSILAPVNVLLQLTVNDTRFDSNATVDVTFTPLEDADGDGLSAFEELSGMDNSLTAANPNGNLTLPGDADSDDDGMNDGAEALAGTNPNHSGSNLAIAEVDLATASNLVLQWSSVTGRTYRVQGTTNLMQPGVAVATNLPATSPLNVHTVTLDGQSGFYQIEVE